MYEANGGPVMQERYTYAVREILRRVLPTQKGICVLVEGKHGCMWDRGVRSRASAITMATSGLFTDDQRMLDRFMFLVRGSNGHA
jgi:GTP cyclohydrolase I